MESLRLNQKQHLLKIVLYICVVFISNYAVTISSAVSIISHPFTTHAPNRTLNGSTGEDPLLNSTNMRFALTWISTTNNKFLLSIIYMPERISQSSSTSSKSSSSVVVSSAANDPTESSIGAQQVWIANRDFPVNPNSMLQLSNDGNLVLRDTDGSIAWSTSTMNAKSLILQDHGNLALLNSQNHIIWQSFDYPADTLLPGQVIATGTQVVASVSYSNASSGKYSVVMEPQGLIMYVDSRDGALPYHVVGFSSVEKNNTVESVQQNRGLCKGTTMAYSYGGGILTFNQIGDASVCNHSFTIPIGSNDNSTDVFFRLDPDGNFRTYVYRLHYGWGIDQEVFSGTLYCALPGKCGSYGICSSYGTCTCPDTELFRAVNPSDPSSGCSLSARPTCGSSEETQTGNQDNNQNQNPNRFVELIGANYFANGFTYQSFTSQDRCKSLCASSCNCSIAFYQQTTRKCYHYHNVMSIQKVADSRYVAYIKVGDRNSSSSYAKRQSSPLSRSNGIPSKVLLVVITLSVILTMICISFFVLFAVKLRQRLADMHADDAFLESLPGLPTRFTFKDLKKATNGFTSRLGVGGFGSVYEGHLPDGTKVAVKRLESARQGQKEFHAEVAALGSINHLNLVRLRGFCTGKSQCLLVYEHMENGSLDKWLFSGTKFLSWPRRYSVALDTARGLGFLHEESRDRIVHLDVKPQNILLDGEFIAKLSDFGLSKLIDRGEMDVVTNMRGTPGYVAPEWLLQAGVTSKSDVYSYGMVLLELVSGRRNVDLSRNTFWYFPAWAVTMVEEGKMMEIVDPRLGVLSDEMAKEAQRIIRVAMWCIQEDPTVRPSMTSVVRILEGHTDVDDAPSLLEFAMRTCSAAKMSSSSSNPQTNSNTTSTSTHVTNSILSAPR